MLSQLGFVERRRPGGRPPLYEFRYPEDVLAPGLVRIAEGVEKCRARRLA
jgi:hypothetical protein